jgi:hypothetical protein
MPSRKQATTKPDEDTEKKEPLYNGIGNVN